MGVPLLEVDADGARADVDPRDPEVGDLAQPLGAVLGRAGDRELVDQLVGSRLTRVEVDLPGAPPAVRATPPVGDR